MDLEQTPHDVEDEYDDDALVFKGVPYSLKKDELLEEIRARTGVAPRAVSYITDHQTGKFKGTVFANFYNPMDVKTILSFGNLNISNKVIKVERKKRAKRERGDDDNQHQHQHHHHQHQHHHHSHHQHHHQHQQQQDLKDDEYHHYYNLLQSFKRGDKSTITFEPSLTSVQRRKLHLAAESLRLYHSSQGEGDNRQIVVSKKSLESFPAANFHAPHTSNRSSVVASSTSDRDESNFNPRPRASSSSAAPKKVEQISAIVIRQPSLPDNTGGFKRERTAVLTPTRLNVNARSYFVQTH